MITIVVLFILGYLIGSTFMSKPEPTVETKEVWCEAGYINSRGELVYSQDHAGRTDFLVLATSQGPKLMVKCDE